MKGNFHVRCEVGENLEITSKSYLSLCYQIAKKKKLKGLKCVAYVAGYTAINSINPFKVAKKAIKCVKAVKKGSKLLKTTKRLKTTKALFKKTNKIKKFSFKKKSSAKKYTKKKAVTTTKKRKKGNAPNRAKFKKQKKQGGGACFTEDTLILTEDGLVEIDEIEVGDFVWSENPETGDITLKEVKETFINKTDILVYITVNNETIKTTEGHLFYVEDIGWIPASMLKEGDVLSLEDGRELPVQSIKEITYNHYINVYNFEVEDYHTYYVSNKSVLVHNMCQTDDVRQIMDYVDNLNEHKKDHIINGSYKKGHDHHWEFLSPNKDWNEIRNIIIQVMKSGKESAVNKKSNIFLKTATIKGHTVQVKYRIQDGIVKVSDAWIKK